VKGRGIKHSYSIKDSIGITALRGNIEGIHSTEPLDL
jgi:hypothetical protein